MQLIDHLRDALLKSLPELSLEPCALPQTKDGYQVSVPVEGSGLAGTVTMWCSSRLLGRTCPIPDKDATVLQDWVSELANLVMGRFKNSLLSQGIAIRIQPPKPSSEAGKFCLVFQDGGDCIALGHDLRGEPKVGTSIVELLPGEAVYRLNEPAHSKKDYDVISKIRSGIESEEIEDVLEDDLAEIEEPCDTGTATVQVQDGCASITINGYHINVERVGADIRITIPELKISLTLSS